MIAQAGGKRKVMQTHTLQLRAAHTQARIPQSVFTTEFRWYNIKSHAATSNLPHY